MFFTQETGTKRVVFVFFFIAEMHGIHHALRYTEIILIKQLNSSFLELDFYYLIEVFLIFDKHCKVRCIFYYWITKLTNTNMNSNDSY